MSDFVLDASLALQWFLEDEADRKYSLAILASLSEKACFGSLTVVLRSWQWEILELPALAHARGLTNYDAAYLAVAKRLGLPLATTDKDLRSAAAFVGVSIA